MSKRHAARAGAGPAAGVQALAAALLRAEAAASSRIEGVTAGARGLAMAAIHRRSSPSAQLVMANVTATQLAVELAGSMSTDTILAVHQALLGGHERAAPGRLRDQQVWIGGKAASPHAACYVPPHHTRVPAALADLVAFIRRADLPVLVQAAIAHAQFETIHPFSDGNGRVGRTVFHAMLRDSGVTRAVILPVSAGLLAGATGYFAALTDYRDGHLEPVIGEFISASARAIRNGRRLVDDLDSVCEAWSGRLDARQDPAARRLLPHLLSQPAVSVAWAETAAGVAPPDAQRAVEQLEAAGVLQRAGGGQRFPVWIARDVIRALNAFAERAGRR